MQNEINRLPSPLSSSSPTAMGRRVGASLAGEGHALPTLSAALLARVQASAMPDQVLLAPATPLEAIPTYRLIDVLRCLDRQPAALGEIFTGKIVLVGTNLPEED